MVAKEMEGYPQMEIELWQFTKKMGLGVNLVVKIQKSITE